MLINLIVGSSTNKAQWVFIILNFKTNFRTELNMSLNHFTPDSSHYTWIIITKIIMHNAWFYRFIQSSQISSRKNVE
jgi:hypothetical protein